jgi:hypothetical protein
MMTQGHKNQVTFVVIISLSLKIMIRKQHVINAPKRFIAPHLPYASQISRCLLSLENKCLVVTTGS